MTYEPLKTPPYYGSTHRIDLTSIEPLIIEETKKMEKSRQNDIDERISKCTHIVNRYLEGCSREKLNQKIAEMMAKGKNNINLCKESGITDHRLGRFSRDTLLKTPLDQLDLNFNELSISLNETEQSQSIFQMIQSQLPIGYRLYGSYDLLCDSTSRYIIVLCRNNIIHDPLCMALCHDYPRLYYVSCWPCCCFYCLGGDCCFFFF